VRKDYFQVDMADLPSSSIKKVEPTPQKSELIFYSEICLY
jgi:hypothetical protein